MLGPWNPGGHSPVKECPGPLDTEPWAWWVVLKNRSYETLSFLSLAILSGAWVPREFLMGRMRGTGEKTEPASVPPSPCGESHMQGWEGPSANR